MATYLHRINQTKHSSCCSHCSQDGSQKESLSHFFSICPKFHHARTAAHNQVCKVLATSLRTHLATHWSLFKETRLSSTGLALELVPADVVLQSGRHIPDSDAAAAEMSLVRWQPGFIAISYTSKNFAIGPEVCRPSDTPAENLVEAYHRKIQAYHPILVALKTYIASGWTIRIIPWVVGTQGLVHEQSVQDALEFLDIPREQRYPIVLDTVRASVEALAFICKLRFSPSLQNRTFDTDNPIPNQVTNAADQNLRRKRKTAVAKESLASTLLRWSKILPLKRK